MGISMRILIAAAMVALFSLPAHAADVWTTLTDPAGVFAIQVPESPTIKNDSTTGNNGVAVPVVEYMIDRNTSAMIVMVGDFTSQNVDPTKAVEGAVQGVQTGNRTLLTDKVDILDGHAGHTVTLYDTDGNQFSDRIFFIDGRLYQVITVVPKVPLAGQVATVARFSDSFHFLR
jgi:hypothetical protein